MVGQLSPDIQRLGAGVAPGAGVEAVIDQFVVEVEQGAGEDDLVQAQTEGVFAMVEAFGQAVAVGIGIVIVAHFPEAAVGGQEEAGMAAEIDLARPFAVAVAVGPAELQLRALAQIVALIAGLEVERADIGIGRRREAVAPGAQFLVVQVVGIKRQVLGLQDEAVGDDGRGAQPQARGRRSSRGFPGRRRCKYCWYSRRFPAAAAA